MLLLILIQVIALLIVHQQITILDQLVIHANLVLQSLLARLVQYVHQPMYALIVYLVRAALSIANNLHSYLFMIIILTPELQSVLQTAQIQIQ